MSFVVPIYNMEKYLSQCLDSILINVKEMKSGVEVILVNDGSTDKSLNICNAYAQKYECIQVINKDNGGISSARNVGLQKASGDYICFIDSDDYYKANFAKTFLDLCYKNDLDIIRGWYSVYDEDVPF